MRLKIFLKNFLQPLNSICDEPYHFIIWFIVSLIIGSAGFWLPVVFSPWRDEQTPNWITLLVQSGSLASFCVVLLADGLAYSLATVRAGKNRPAAGIRGIFGVLAILIILIQASILAALTVKGPPSSGQYGVSTIQILLTILAMLLAIYLYCFRSPDWEKGVDKVKEKEDTEVKRLSEAATTKASDDSGVKL